MGVVLGGHDHREQLPHADAGQRVPHLLAAGAGDHGQLGTPRQPADQVHRAGKRPVPALGEDGVLLFDGGIDELAHGDRQRVVAHHHRVDLVPRVTDDEAPLLVGHLGAVAAQRQHHGFDVLALAVDQRSVEVEQKGFGRGEFRHELRGRLPDR